MNTKRWLLASVAVVAVIVAQEFLVHRVLLHEIYLQTTSVWRARADILNTMWLYGVGCLVFAPVFALIYVKGYEVGKSGLGQGLRYGVYMGLLIGVALTLGWYVVLPISATLAVYWAIAGMVEMIVAGIVVGLIYKS